MKTKLNCRPDLGAAAFIATIRQTAPITAKPFLPIHDESFAKCSKIIFSSMHLASPRRRALPLPSAMLPPPM